MGWRIPLDTPFWKFDFRLVAEELMEEGENDDSWSVLSLFSVILCIAYSPIRSNKDANWNPFMFSTCEKRFYYLPFSSILGLQFKESRCLFWNLWGSHIFLFWIDFRPLLLSELSIIVIILVKRELYLKFISPEPVPEPVPSEFS